MEQAGRVAARDRDRRQPRPSLARRSRRPGRVRQGLKAARGRCRRRVSGLRRRTRRRGRGYIMTSRSRNAHIGSRWTEGKRNLTDIDRAPGRNSGSRRSGRTPSPPLPRTRLPSENQALGSAVARAAGPLTTRTPRTRSPLKPKTGPDPAKPPPDPMGESEGDPPNYVA